MEGILQFDGALGTELIKAGYAPQCLERLSLDAPDAVRAVHRAYVEAGAQVIETNTLGANPKRLATCGLQDYAAEITRAAITIAREAGAPFVACSMGTSVANAGLRDLDTFAAAEDCFRPQAQAAAEAGADILFTETLIDVAEARTMWLAARAAGVPFGASFTFRQDGKTPMGNPAEVCALTAEALGAVMIGVNCVGDKALLLDVLARMRAVSVLPVIVQPNAGVPEKREGVSRYTVSPGDMAETMQEAVQMGASGIGGCCGTTPEHIRRMAVLSAQAEQPKPVNDGKKRICSLTKWTTFLEAADSAEEWTPGSAGNPDAAAIWLDMRGMRPNNAAAWVMRVQQHTAAPLLFRVNNPEVLAAATRVYAGVACADGA